MTSSEVDENKFLFSPVSWISIAKLVVKVKCRCPDWTARKPKKIAKALERVKSHSQEAHMEMDLQIDSDPDTGVMFFDNSTESSV